MFCKNCGKLIKDGDKFCSNCGEKVEPGIDFGFAQGTPTFAGEPEKPKKRFHVENFDWNLDGYPTDNTKPTEDIDFDWQSVVEEKQRRVYADRLESKKEPETTPTPTPVEEKSLEEEIFGDLSQDFDNEPTKIIDKEQRENRVDKFYTYNKKNADFQALLDQEYEKIQNGTETDEEEIAFEPIFMAEKEPEPAPMPSIPTEPIPSIPPTALEEEEVPPEFVAVALSQTPESVLMEENPAPPEVVEIPEIQIVEEVAVTEEPVVDEFPSTEEEPCPPSTTIPAEAEEERSAAKLTFNDIFSDDDDSDEGEKKPKKRNKALKIIAIVLCVLIALELVIIGIMYFGKGTPLANKLNSGYLYITNMISGEDKDKQNSLPSEPVDVETEIGKIITTQSMYNKNIGTIEEDPESVFDLNADYGIDEMSETFGFSNSTWYTDNNNTPVKYGDEIIATTIKYFSSWVDMANGVDEVILDYVDETADLYEAIEDFENKDGVAFGINKLTIGEIRNGSRGFYVMTTTTKVDSDTNKETVENGIVYMEPVNKTMKIFNIYKF